MPCPSFLRPAAGSRTRFTGAVLLLCLFASGRPAQAQELPPGVLPVEEFSPLFLGMYRKVMVVEDGIRRYALQYGVDFDLARAVCLYESGGNAGLASGAGARGYFQVMPPSFRELRVTTNLEAGVKYLAQMIRQFGREDRAIAAYNGGPGRINRGGALPMETLQYVMGVGHYRAVLKQHDDSIRYHASRLQIATVQAGDSWSTLAARLDVPELELRMHNPFLAARQLRVGQLVAYSPTRREDLLLGTGGYAEYRMRHGDNYLNLAHTIGIEPEAIRTANSLWQLQIVSAGVPLRIPLAAASATGMLDAVAAPPLADDPIDLEPAPVRRPAVERAAAAPDVDRVVTAAAPARAAAARRASPAARTIVHRVQAGDTLFGLARRYDTTVAAIQQANKMGRRSTIRRGERLTMPAASSR